MSKISGRFWQLSAAEVEAFAAAFPQLVAPDSLDEGDQVTVMIRDDAGGYFYHQNRSGKLVNGGQLDVTERGPILAFLDEKRIA